MAYDNILVAVDRTDDAEQVIKAAQEFAKGNSPTISVVTVVWPISDYYTSYYLPYDDLNGKRIEKEAKEQAATWLSDLTKRCGIDAKTLEVTVGRPAVEIRRLAEKLDIDLIVIGTHGRHGVGLMLGSTANAVLHGTQCSVLAVRVRAEESE
jgi:universal stress protein A